MLELTSKQQENTALYARQKEKRFWQDLGFDLEAAEIEAKKISNVQLERILIGKLLGDSDRFDDWQAKLNLNLFVDPTCRSIYSAIAKCYEQKQEYDVLSIIDWFKRTGTGTIDEKIPGGEKTIIELYSILDGGAIESLLELLAHYQFRRRLIVTGLKVENLGKTETIVKEETIALITKETEKLFELSNTQEMVLVEKTADRISEYINNGTSKGIPTGINQLDRSLGGFKPGKVYIVGARTGMGKTNISVFFAHHLAKVNEKKLPVLFLSAEMSLESLAIRFIAHISKINSSFISNNRMSHEERNRFAPALEEYKKLNLIIDEAPAQSLDGNAIAEKLRYLKREYGGTAAIFIDYIQLLGSYTANRRDLAIGEVIRTCKDLSKQFDVPFIVLAQVRREVESRSDKRPGLSDLKDSGTLEQAADAIMFLYRDEYYNPDTTMSPGITELILAKNRDGCSDRIELEHSLGTCDYREIKPRPVFR